MRTVRSWLSVCTNGALASLALACALGAGATGAAAMPADSGAVVALAASCGTDEFEGSTLDDARWDVLRPAGTGPAVAGGKLHLELRNTDLIGGSATAENLVLQDAPNGGWTATTTFDTAAINEAGEQAGVALWKSEGPPALNNAFGKVVAIRTNQNVWKFEAIWTDGGGLAMPIADSGVTLDALPAQATIRLRSDGEWVTAEYRDGDTWTQIGRPAKYDAPLRVGAVALRGAAGGGTVGYERFELTCGPEVTLEASALTGAAPLDVDFTAMVSDPAADLSWRFGDGATADGGAEQSHTFTEPGTYRVRVTAEDEGGQKTVRSVRVVVGDGAPAQRDDEFVGNELDPKWEILRPRATLRDVADGALKLGNAGGDMHGNNASAPNVVLQALPDGPAVASTQIDVSTLVNGGDQVGMVVWRSENPNHFAKVVYNRRSATEYWFERSRTDNGATSGGNTGTVTGSPAKIQIRIASSGGANPTFTPERSVDGGQTWAAVQAPFSLAGAGPVKVGLTFFSGNSLRTAAFDWFHLEGDEPVADPGCATDAFDGTELDRDRWTTIVRENAAGMRVAGGKLHLNALRGDLYGDRDTAQNLVLQDLPSDAWTATTELDSTAFDREGQQAGIVVRKDGVTFSKFVVINKGAQGRWFEHIFTKDQQARLEIGTDTTPPLPADYPALVRIRVISDGQTIRGEYSAAGRPWQPIGRPAAIGGDVQVGVYAADNGQDGPEIPFEHFTLGGQSDEFGGDEFDVCRWERVLGADADAYTVGDGKLEIEAPAGEVQDDTMQFHGQPVPAGTWEAITRIDLDTTDEGQQAGLLLYKDPDNWIKSVLVDKNTASQIELVRVKDGNYQLDAPFKVDVPKDMTTFQLRLRSNGTTLSSQYSTDGINWTEVGQARDITDLATGRLGPMAVLGGADPITAAFDYVRIGSWTPPTAQCTANGTPEAGFTHLWNGISLDGTAQAGPGGFNVVSDGAEGCRLVSNGGMGMLWFNAKQYDNFVLRTQFKTADATDNSGILVRFPNPGNDPWVAINNGHEIQVREGVQGDGEDQKTGSVYNFDREDKRAGKPPGQWNDYEIRYEGGKYTITLNGEVVNEWQNDLRQAKTAGYIGLQNHGPSDEVSFRNIRIQELTNSTTNLFTTIGITRSETRQNSGINGSPTKYSLPAEEMPPSKTVGPAPNDAVDDVPLRMPDTSGTQPNLAAFNGQTLTLREQDRKQYSKIHFFGTTTDGGPAGGDFVLRYSDSSTQTINVQFRDWCAPQNTPEHHQAIGPLTKRHRETGEDGARCGIYHVPANAQADKTLVSVTLPSSTSPGNPPIQSYLMALTLEEPDGFFETPDLSGQVAFPDDETAPVTTHMLNPGEPNGNDSWYAGPVRVTLTATDEQGGSGVERMMYRVDGGTAQPYTGPFDFTVEGEHTLEYASIDGAGNAEGFKSVLLKIDVSAPTTVARTSPGNPLGTDGWHDGAVTVTLTSRDGQGSGAALTEYRVDGGEWDEYETPVVIEEAGVHDIDYRSTDVAGNEEEAASLTVKVDRTAPVTTARLNGAAPVAEYTGPVRVALTRTDGDGSGAVATEYRIGAGAWTEYTSAFDVEGLSGHRVDFRSRDVAGNVENFRSVIFVIRPVTAAAGTPPPPVTAPKPSPFAALGELAHKRSTVSALRRGKLAVRVSCQAVESGTVRLTVSRRTAKRLRLSSRVLAKGMVRCGEEGRANVTLKPTRKVKRALARRTGAIAATLALRMGETNDTAEVVLRGSR